jgi:hypothetical protein
MHKLPLSDELPYQFRPPRLSPFRVRASRLFVGYTLRRVQFVSKNDANVLESLPTRLLVVSLDIAAGYLCRDGPPSSPGGMTACGQDRR